ncbi:hypothetical protein P691DRAFT_812887 [Macrolepiota fuliginosa MF-IS2]|uniref:Uncharacterized protein n=1 Tax=Macrolepiota fuliginosa MF-IS2 TaxID=1400762 RepID=A0A9P5XD57_9AGAR|nr:hypothetical protein P691DRAFT_812887 [Macrolepiota fuliginosa MF-IS2]
MSIVSTIFSSRSSSRINARLVSLMDNVFAIAFGLGVRFVVDTVSHRSLRLAGTLVGLWEGVVTLHFLKKMPKSFDPYIAYLVRLFVDFLVTESLLRLVLVVVWTGLGMVLADIAPAIWHDVGAHRIWRRFRRDMYYVSRSLPRIPPIVPRARVVRFSPVIEPTDISETMSTLSPTAATPTITSQAPTHIVPPTPAVPREKRPIPGRFTASEISETDTERGSALGLRPGASSSAVGTSRVRYTMRPRRPSIDIGSPAPAPSIDDSNISSDASSVSTDTASQPIEIEEEIEVPVRSRDKNKGKERAIEEGDSDTPTRRPIELPPTPSDSAPRYPNRASVVPTITGMPSIPDFFESGLGSDWENIRKEEAEHERPPSPPEKDFDSPPPQEFGLPPAQDLGSPPAQDFRSPPARDSRSPPVQDFRSPPVHYVPPPSAYAPTPRPSHFDQDLWDDVSNIAPPTPYTRATPKQRASRSPPPTSTIPTSIPTVPKSKKKRTTEPPPPPPIPQTPVYGDAWDTEKDQLPPSTPSFFTRTPIQDSTSELNNNNETQIPPTDSNTVPPVEADNQDPIPTPGAPDIGGELADPWADASPPVQQQDEQQERNDPAPEQTGQRSVPPTPQVKTRAPPTPSMPSRAPPTPQQQSKTVPPTPQQQSGTIPPTPHQPLKSVPPTPQQPLKSVPPTPQQPHKSIPPTPQQQTKTVPPTPLQQPKTVPPTPLQQPKTVPSTPWQAPKNVPPTPQQPLKSVSPTPHQPSKSVPPTPQVAPKTVPPTPHQPTTAVPPTPQQRTRTPPKTMPPPTPAAQRSRSLFDDFDFERRVYESGGGPATGSGGPAVAQQQQQQQQQQQSGGDLVDLGGDDNGGRGGSGSRSPEDTGDGNGGDGNGEDPNADAANNEANPEDTGQIQFDEHNNPLSPASSGYSSVAGVPSQIKERNKQAIIIRAQIVEVTNAIDRLKEDKLRAEGREELDPLNEESAVLEQEIKKAEKSLEKLKKRSEKRYQAAVDSTNHLTSVPKTLNLNFETSSAEQAAAKLEDTLGLFFGPERKTVGLSIAVPKGGPGKNVKAAIQKVFDEYGIRSIPKVTGVSVVMGSKTYFDMVTAFRQKHAKADDS